MLNNQAVMDWPHYDAEKMKRLVDDVVSNVIGQPSKGFVDTHLHLVEYGKVLMQVDLRGTASMAELIERLRAAGQLPIEEMPVIEAFGWNQETMIEGRMPNRYDLDCVATDRPVLLSRICGHVTAVNSYVLSELSADKGLPQAMQEWQGGQFDCDANGLPTGILRERARDVLKDQGYYNGDKARVRACILKAQQDLNQKGITCVHSDDLTCFPNLQATDILDVFKGMAEAGELSLDVIEQAQGEPYFLAQWQSTYENELSKQETRRGGRFKIGSLKLFTDGSLGARTAYLLEDYADQAGNRGISIYRDQALYDIFQAAFRVNLPLTVHAIGDGAIDQVLRAFEVIKAMGAQDDYLMASGIVHFQVTNEDILERMARLKLRAYIQPIFLHEDAKVVYSRLGSQRANASYLWRTMQEMGIPLWFGSDAPIETPDPLMGLYCAIARKTLDDHPIEYLPSQGLDLEWAVLNAQLGHFE